MFFKTAIFRSNPTTSAKNEESCVFRGLFYAMLSGAVYSVVSMIVKYMKNLHPGQLAVYRFLSTFVMCLPETVKTEQKLLGPRNLRFLLMLRGIVAGCSLFLCFIAFRYLGLGEASVIIHSAPAIVTIFARVFLKEPCNKLQSFTVFITIVGIILTAKLPSRSSNFTLVYSSEKIYGLLASVVAMFFVGTQHLITRKVRSVHSSISTFHLSWMAILVNAALTAAFGNFQLHQCGIQIVFILIFAVLSYAGLTFLVKALQYENAGPVSTVRAATDIVFAFLWQILIFHDIPDLYGIIGAILVVLSIILIGVNKCKDKLQCNLLPLKKLFFSI